MLAKKADLLRIQLFIIALYTINNLVFTLNLFLIYVYTKLSV